MALVGLKDRVIRRMEFSLSIGGLAEMNDKGRVTSYLCMFLEFLI